MKAACRWNFLKWPNSCPPKRANPDFGLIARGNGIAYRCVERREELAGAVAGMKACKGAYLLEVRVESEENVFPMVPAGAPVSAIRLE